MRLHALHLVRYGKFTDFSLDFGAATKGAPDFHIVYGANEAGKSTLFSAWLDLLYGMGRQTPYDFIHPYDTLRIEADLSADRPPRRLARIKANNHTLRDAHDRPIPERVIEDLVGLGRDAYTAMYSLNNETLQSGGDAILKAQGELGQALFAGSSGLAGFARTLGDLRSEAEAFYKPGAKKPGVKTFTVDLEAVRQKRVEILVRADEFAKLQKTSEEATSLHAALVTERAENQVARDRLARIGAARPRLAELDELVAQRAPLADLPGAPESWADEARELEKSEVRLKTALDGAMADLKALSDRAAAIVIDTVGQHASGLFGDIDKARTLFVDRENSLPNRREDLRTADREIESLMKRLGRADEAEPEAIRPTTPVQAAVSALLNERNVLDAKRATAREEALRAGDKVARARARLGKDHGASGDDDRGARLQALDDAVTAWRSGNFDARVQSAEQERAKRTAAMDTAMNALRPWRGDASAIETLVTPSSAELQAWSAAFDDLEREIRDLRREIDQIEGQRTRHAARRDAVRETAAIVTDAEATAIRAARDAAWAEHRTAMAQETADAFEALLRQDDEASASRIANAADYNALRDAIHALADAEATRVALKARQDDIRKRRDDLDKAVRAATAEIAGLPAVDWTPPVFVEWTERLASARAPLQELGDARRELAGVKASAVEAEGALRRALDAVGVATVAEDDSAALAAKATAALKEDRDRAQLRGALREAEAEHRQRIEHQNELETGLTDWTTRFEAACADWGCWPLGAPAPEIARAHLDESANLAELLSNREEARDRIEKIRKDQEAFVALMARAAAAIDLPADTPPLETAQTFAERIRRATRATEEKDKLERDIAQKQDAQRERKDALTALEARKAEMTAFLGVGSLAETVTRLADIVKRDDLTGRIAKLERQIVEDAALDDIAAVRTAVAETDAEVAERALRETETRLSVLDEELQQAYAAKTAAGDTLAKVSGDADAARLATQCAAIVDDAREAAKDYMRQMAGIIATEEALRRYRDIHRTSMMQSASDTLAALTCGDYAGLATQPGDKGEVLVAKTSDGQSKLSSGLSTSARAQLFLALRIAGYHEFADNPGQAVAPFIADDIMETFDDERAAATFGLLGEMSRKGQVIYLTHHRHLCDIARDAFPDVRIHTLP